MTKWSIDPIHSEIGFKVKHLMISTVSGKFNNFSAQVETLDDDSFSGAKISFSADVNSISTGMEQRDNHLKSDDFFNAVTYPQINFISSGLEKIDSNNFTANGNFTIRDVTKPLTLNVKYLGLMTDFYGNIKAGFEATGTLNRQDFGLQWNAVTEAGGVVVSNQVKLHLDIQMQKETN